MNQVHIITPMGEVLYDVLKTVANFVSQLPGGAKQYPEAVISHNDYHLLETFWAEATHEIRSLLTPYIVESQANNNQQETNINNALQLTLTLPNNWKPETLQKPLEQAIKNYAVQLIQKAWFTNIAPETGEIFSRKVIVAKLAVQFLLYRKQTDTPQN